MIDDVIVFFFANHILINNQNDEVDDGEMSIIGFFFVGELHASTS